MWEDCLFGCLIACDHSVRRFCTGSFSGGGFAHEGAGWLRKMAYLTLSGLGIAGVMNTGKLAMQSFQGIRDAYQQSGLAQPGESFTQSIGHFLRRGFQFSAGAFGGLAGMALAVHPV